MIVTELESKAALVTGGSRGIGASIVRRLAREGASVAFTYLASRSMTGKYALLSGRRRSGSA